MILRRQLEVYRNARRTDGFDVAVLDAAIVRISQPQRALRLAAIGGMLVGLAMTAAAAFAQ